jgi:hypothetical protein
VNAHAKRCLLIVLSVILVAWGALGFFEGAYFASFFYGVPAPSWTLWVGQLPIWWLNAVDTAMAAVLILAIYLSFRSGRKHRASRRLTSSTRAGGGSWAWTVIGILLLASVLGYLGLTLTGLMSSFLRFVGLGH